MRLARYAALAAILAGCADAPEPALSETAQLATVNNGSFETGDYTGWTLLEEPVSPACGTFGIVSDGQTIQPAEEVFDFADNLLVVQNNPTLPVTYAATDGTQLAIQLQNCGQTHRMSQDVAIPACAPLVRWDMMYNNTTLTFDAANQFTAVNVRDPATDAILATPYKTTQDVDPTSLATMTAFEADLAAFSGQTVRLDFEHQVLNGHFGIAWDHIRIECRGLTPNPASVEFGTVRVGTTSAPTQIELANDALQPITITEITPTPPFGAANLPSLPVTLAPGESITAGATFAPTVAGEAFGGLVIQSDDPVSPTLTVPLQGVGGEPGISVAGIVDFGDVRVGTTRDQDVTVTNTGTAPLTVTSADATGDFTTLTPMPIVIPPGASAPITVRFAPSAPGPANEAMTIVSDSPNGPAFPFLQGNGIAPAIAVDPPSFDFHEVRVGNSSGAVFFITNTGSDTLTISSVTAGGAFAASAATPIAIAPGNQAGVAVTCTPPAPGTFSGDLVITSDAATSPTLVPLSCTGVAPAIAVDPTSLEFGNVRVGTPRLASVTVSNPGSDTLVISSALADGAFTVVNAPSFIVPGGSATIDVQFLPAAEGPAAGDLTIVSDAATSPTVVPLSGTGVAPKLVVDPSALDFGPQRVGVSRGATITLSNPGTDVLTISSLATGSGDFTVLASAPIVLAPGGSTAFTVLFTPSIEATVSDTLTIVSDAATSPTTVALTGTGVAPAIAVDPPALSFGDVRVGTTVTRTVTVSNPGTDTLTISSITADGAFAAATAAPLLVAPGDTAAIDVDFTPPAVGAATGTLTIVSDASAQPTTIALDGAGIAPAIAIDPPAVAFGDVRVGETAPATVTVSNPGTATLTISALAVSGAPFAIADAAPIVIAPGSLAKLTVQFAPTSAGPFAGTLEIASDATPNPITVALTGTGVEPLIAIDPGAVAFGNRRVGVAGPTELVTVTNPGTANLTISALAIDAPFSIVGPATPQVVPPGASVAIEIAFVPAATGPAEATLAITSDAATGPTTVTVTGTGTLPGLTPTATDLAFGTVKVGEAVSRTVTLTNTGDAPAQITDTMVSGPFTVEGPALPFGLLPDASVTFTITFQPTTAGVATGGLAFVSDAPASPTITLAGTGGTPAITADPTAVEFGEIALGTRSAPQAVELRNPGTSPLVITAITTDGPFARASIALPLTLAPGDARSINVVFAPTAAGAATGALDVASDAGDVVVPLSGSGLELEPPAPEGGCDAGGGGGSLALAAGLIGLVARRRRPRHR